MLRASRLKAELQTLTILLAAAAGLQATVGLRAAETPRPNILWITSEDNGPHLGCYGDKYADTPQLDRLAARGFRYLNCWSNAPVCAPARTAIISGMYPPSIGAEHMRSMTRLPAGMKIYPQLLRAAGYYCTNNRKEDYNLAQPEKIWDESSSRAHWKNRAAGQPFFAVFNHTVSHESQIRKRPHKLVHDPDQVRLPAYHPDTPEVRHDWAQYYDKVTEMDAQAGKDLAELAAAGLADETIVFYYGDHGSGMPRSKRWPYNSGLHVPLIVYIPEKFAHLRPPGYEAGGSSARPVAFVDLAPTVLSLAGVRPPKAIEGDAFLGPYARPPRRYNYGFRGRMDERCDLVRSVRDERYIYIRNYMPHRIYGQYLDYMFQTPTTRIWKRLYDAGKLVPPQTYFWEEKPCEELYDLEHDSEEVHNLAGSPAHRQVRDRLRAALAEWLREICDVGFLPEDQIHSRSRGSTPYTMGHDPARYPFGRIFETADMAASRDLGTLAELQRRLTDADSAVRYWAVVGMLVRGRPAAAASWQPLRRMLGDEAPSVRIVAAEALARYGSEGDLQEALQVLLDAATLDHNSVYVAVLALNSLDQLDLKTAGVLDQIRSLPRTNDAVPGRMKSYVGHLIDDFFRPGR